MNISKNSWHYRFITESFVGSESITRVPDSLCPYMRRLAFVFMMSVFVYALAVGVASLIVHVMGFLVLAGVYGFVDPGAGLFGFSIGLAVVLLLLGLSSLVCYVINLVLKKAQHTVESKPDNIFIEYAKSVHNKFCPKIEFKD